MKTELVNPWETALTEEVLLAKLSFCPCGFPALNESIPLGTQYRVYPRTKTHHVWKCGGCGSEQSLASVYVAGRGPSHGGFLPALLFTPVDQSNARHPPSPSEPNHHAPDCTLPGRP